MSFPEHMVPILRFVFTSRLTSPTLDVISISGKDWTQSGKFVDKEVAGTTTALAISPNGAYLATACQSTVYIWTTDKRQVIAKCARLLHDISGILIVLYRQSGTSGAVITQLAFSPKEHLIAWTDASGNFIRWREPIPSNLPSSIKRISPATTATSKSISGVPQGVDLFDEDNGLSLDDLEGFEELDDPTAGAEGGDGFNIDDADFVIDDVGGYLEDKPAMSRGNAHGLVREMGKMLPTFRPTLSLVDIDFSEHHQSSACISTGSNAVPRKQAIFGYDFCIYH